MAKPQPPTQSEVLSALSTLYQDACALDHFPKVSAFGHIDALAEELTGTADYCERQTL